MLARIVILLSICCVACGGSELEFADWVQLMPDEATPVFEYAAVSLEERQGERIEVVEDLVIGDDASNPDQVFYRASGVAADDVGTIYVLDSGSHRIQVFDAEGGYLRTLGQEGQGPGELATPSNLVIGAGQVILKAESRRLSVWTLAGEHIRDTQLLRSLTSLAGTDAGFIARYGIRPPPTDEGEQPPRTLLFALFDTSGEEKRVYAELTEPPPTTIAFGGGGIVMIAGAPISDFTPRFVAARQGNVYLTASREYQVHAFGPHRWALRVAWPRQAVRETDIDTAMERMSSPLFDQVDRSDFPWPDHFPAISSLEIDGHGHLYVFPFFAPLNAPIGPDEERPQVDRPVDVYSATGEHLFSGMIPVWSWSGSLGDFVYTTRINDITDEYEVVRYRLVEPF